MEIVLKKIEPHEREELKNLLKTYWSEIDEEFLFENQEQFIENYLNLIFSPQCNRMIQWIFLKKIKIGFVFYYFYNINLDRKGIHIAEFYIQPEYRRKGLGKKTMEWLENTYKSISEFRLEVLDTNKTAQLFWNKNGFSVWKHILKKTKGESYDY